MLLTLRQWVSRRSADTVSVMNKTGEHSRRASSFGSQAAAYDTYRPTYPAAFVDWALATRPDTGLPVVDLGAGTGKLTEGLLAAGAEVIAVEPDPAILG